MCQPASIAVDDCCVARALRRAVLVNDTDRRVACAIFLRPCTTPWHTHHGRLEPTYWGGGRVPTISTNVSIIVCHHPPGLPSRTILDRTYSAQRFYYAASSLGGGRILRRTLSVRLSVCPSVRPVIVTERHVAPPSELQ